MLKVTRPTPSHFGIFVTDVEKMVHFYKTIFSLTETDRGVGKTFKAPLVFLSASPDQHHQLVIAGGRPAEATFSTVMQLSFAVPSIQHLRDIKNQPQSWGQPASCRSTMATRCRFILQTQKAIRLRFISTCLFIFRNRTVTP